MGQARHGQCPRAGYRAAALGQCAGRCRVVEACGEAGDLGVVDGIGAVDEHIADTVVLAAEAYVGGRDAGAGTEGMRAAAELERTIGTTGEVTAVIAAAPQAQYAGLYRQAAVIVQGADIHFLGAVVEVDDQVALVIEQAAALQAAAGTGDVEGTVVAQRAAVAEQAHGAGSPVAGLAGRVDQRTAALEVHEAAVHEQAAVGQRGAGAEHLRAAAGDVGQAADIEVIAAANDPA